MVRRAGGRGGGLGESVLTSRLLERIAACVGTPAYVYDAAAIRERYTQLANALSVRFASRIHYSVKANSNLAILRLLRDLGAGADIVSGGELARVLAAGFAPGAIVFSGVGKTTTEIRSALRAGPVLINIESQGELVAIDRVAAELDTSVDLGVRINPEVSADTHRYTQTGGRNVKFGVPMDAIPDIAHTIRVRQRLRLVSVGMHIGSQIADAEPYRTACARLTEAVRVVCAAGVDSLRSVNVGGGLAIQYAEGRPALAPEDFADAVAPLATETGLPVLVEPGRFIVGNAGRLLTRVLYRKSAGDRNLAVVDGGMSELLRPSLYEAEHEIIVVGAPETTGAEAVDVVGPICETGDFLGFRRRLEGATPGALLAVLGAGAYGFSMSSNYNSRPRPPEVLVDGDQWAVIRPRETVDDLMRGEDPDPTWQT